MKKNLKQTVTLLIMVNIVFSITYIVTAQETSMKELNIGDTVPDFVINSVSNYHKEFFKISDLKGKLVLLDFWGVNCVGCIEAFPKLDSLQKQFGEKVQILLVTPSSQQFIDSENQKRLKKIKLPDLISVTSDSIFRQLFKYRLIPHVVWISEDGKVKAITNGQYINADNIKTMLSGGNLSVSQKRDFVSFNYREAHLPQLYPQYPDHMKYYSTILEYTPGIWGGTRRFDTDSTNGTIRITRPGTLLYFAGDIFSHFNSGDPFESALYDFGKRVVLETRDSNKYVVRIKNGSSADYEKWQANIFIYETVLPLMPEMDAYRNYLNDINRFFGIKASLEKRKMKCISLEVVGDTQHLKYLPGAEQPIINDIDSNEVYHCTGLLSIFRNELSKANRKTEFCFVENTGLKFPVQLSIQSSLSDLPSLRIELLRKYNLDLKERVMEVDVLVLRDSKPEDLKFPGKIDLIDTLPNM